MPRPNQSLVSIRNRMDATFNRVNAITSEDLEVQSDFARYLCVLVSGLVETTVFVLSSAYCRDCCSPAVANYAASQLSHLQNVKSEKLAQLLGSFDPKWRTELQTYIDGSRKDALDSVVDLKNKIAHGESVGVTYVRIKEYYSRITEIIDFVESKFRR